MSTERKPDAVMQLGRATVEIYGAPPTPEKLIGPLQQFMRAVEKARAEAKNAEATA